MTAVVRPRLLSSSIGGESAAHARRALPVHARKLLQYEDMHYTADVVAAVAAHVRSTKDTSSAKLFCNVVRTNSDEILHPLIGRSIVARPTLN